jgi:hypothetical protein
MESNREVLSGRQGRGIRMVLTFIPLIMIILFGCAQANTPLPAPDIQSIIQQTRAAQTAAVQNIPPTVIPTLAATDSGPADSGLLFGPASGEMAHQDGKLWYEADVNVSDFDARVTFYNPNQSSSDTWEYGIAFRGSGEKWMFLRILSDRTYSLECGTGGNLSQVHANEVFGMNTQPGQANTVELIATGLHGKFYVNGTDNDGLDLSCTGGTGKVSLNTGWLPENRIEGGITRFTDFTINQPGSVNSPQASSDAAPTTTFTASVSALTVKGCTRAECPNSFSVDKLLPAPIDYGAVHPVTVVAGGSLYFGYRWCAKTQPIRDDNLQNMVYVFTIDGVRRDTEMKREDYSTKGMYCSEWSGEVGGFQAGHSYLITEGFLASVSLNDGWNDIPASTDMVLEFTVNTNNPSSSQPSPTITPTLPGPAAAPTVSVSLDTNCRTGPGEPYPSISWLYVGETAEVVGRSPGGDFWIIKNIHGSGTCWLWKQYATTVGDISGMPVVQPPPLPKTTGDGTRNGGQIDFDHPVTGTINNDIYAEFWYFTGEKDQVISILMSSPAAAGNLDSYLELWYADAGEWRLVTYDDNSGGGDNRRDALILAYQLLEDGDYAITAERRGEQSGTTSGQYGLVLASYVSEATNGQASWSFAPCDMQFKTGTEKTYKYTGEINQNSPSGVHTFDGLSGDALTLIMTRSSGDLNPLVELRYNLALPNSSSGLSSIDLVLAYAGVTEPAQNNTGIYHFYLPKTGKYKIVATRYGWDGGSSSGQYTLSVHTGTPLQDKCSNWTWNRVPKPGDHQGGITVALIDSGIDLGMLDQGVYDMLLDGYSYKTNNIITRNQLTDTCWDIKNQKACHHGTYWANLIHQIAPDVRILPIIDSGIDSWAEAIQYAVGKNVDIINMSFANQGVCKQDLQGAIDQANAADILVVAAVGNNPGDPTLMAPARCLGVVGVGVSPDITNSNETVDLVVEQNTSSAATATISAYAALIWEKNPDYYNRWVWCALKASTGIAQRSNDYGWGAPDIDRALANGAVGCSLGGPP